ncbi:uncharacterized protein LOC113312282 [Papaver somniferum]|uniref:uncharacterized protein LOC113312282 n=1 Tax=Papaver somniferum TaxID=3469 RepID=UPI000E700BF2|nr:uncharacterized protein LOC113312282 [Papaver somniferum]
MGSDYESKVYKEWEFLGGKEKRWLLSYMECNVETKKPEKRENVDYQVKKVKDLIIQGEWKWDEIKLQQLFTPTEVTKIKEIHIPVEPEESRNNKLINEFPWKKFWRVRNIPPRIQIFVWRMLQNGLPVARNIKKHIHGINDDCRLCDRKVECMEHLFLYCQVTQAVFFASPLSLRIGECPNQSVQDIILQWMEEGGDHSKLKMGICVFWEIWKARNEVVFNKKKFSVQKVIQEALYWYNMKMEVVPTDVQLTEDDLMGAEKDYWEPPEGEKIKIDFDGAAGSKGFACGVIARDKGAKVLGCQNKIIDYCTADETEAFSALLAVELGFSKGFRNIILEGDSLHVINALKHKHYTANWKIKNTISGTRDELKNFKSVEFRYIRKNANNVAHNLAALAVSNRSSNVWLSTPPLDIVHLIENEQFVVS